MFERFTAEARGVVMRARQEARQLRHPYIGTEHLLLAMLSDEAGIAYTVLHDAGLDAERVRADIERLIGTPSKLLGDDDAAALQTIGIDLDAVLAKIEETFGPEALEPPAPPSRRGIFGRRQGTGSRLTQRSKKAIELSLREAIHLRHDYIGSEHILLGLLREGDGLAAKIIVESGLTIEDLRRATLAAMKG